MRLIDVDAFKKYMGIPEPDENGNFTEEQERFLYGIVIFMSELAMELDCAPTVEIASAVHCNRCKHIQLRDYICDITGQNVKPDDFCSRGEQATQ